jgi:putative glutamine amidotransferase
MTKPLRIGVSACLMHPDPQRNLYRTKTLLYAEQSMMHWLMAHNALPFLLPTAHAGFSLSGMLDELDGLLLQGGADIAPESYGETPLDPAWSGDRPRDIYEIDLVHAALAANKPILGICRGAQLLNVALGGDMYQDIATQIPHALQHRDAERYDNLHHDIAFVPQTPLAALYHDAPTLRINSIHHQAIRKIGRDLQVEARSPHDQIVEAIRLAPQGQADPLDTPYAFGVQWHPEFQDPRDPSLLNRSLIMEEFFQAIRRRKKP